MWKCGIELILEKTFDFIGHSLKSLTLSHNNLKTIRPALLNGMMLENSIDAKSLYVSNNPLECDCEMWSLQNLILLNIKIFSGLPIMCNVTRSNGTELVSILHMNLTCENMQTIQIERVCSHVYLMPTEMAYTRFRMNRIANSILIRTNASQLFRIWTIRAEERMQQRCKSETWLLENVKCLLVNNVTRIIQSNFLVSHHEYTVVSIMHMTRSKIWPLHLMTFYLPTKTTFYLPSKLMLLSLSLTGLCLGMFVSYIASSIVLQRKATETKHQASRA